MRLRDAAAPDTNAVLALNAASVAVLSPLTREHLGRLWREAAAYRVIEDHDQVVAFLLAFREGAAYDSPNYRWFAERYGRFLYVDRVVVAAAARGRGAGALLYRDLFDLAAADAVGLVTCEYDLEPPNPASARFHVRFGFHEVGRQRLADRKLVSLQVAQVPGGTDR